MNLNDFFEDTNEGKCPHCNGPMFSELMINEKKDACYYKVKSRYKVWPSAYASGALVKCRKRHGKWGSKSESAEQDVAEGSLNEFDPGEGGFGPFKLYKGDNYKMHHVGTFKSMDDAKEELEFQKDQDSSEGDVSYYKIVDGTGEQVGGFNPDEAHDTMRSRQKIKHRRPGQQGVAEAQTDYQKRRQRERDVDTGKPVKRQPKNPQNDYFARRKKERDLAEDQPVQLSSNITAKPNQDPDSGEDWDYYYKGIQIKPGQDFHTQIKDQHMRMTNPAYDAIRDAFDNPIKPSAPIPQNQWPENQPGQDRVVPDYSNPSGPDFIEPKRYITNPSTGQPLKLKDLVPHDPDILESRLYYNVIGTPDKELRTDFGMRKDKNGWYLKESSNVKYQMMAQRAFGSPKLKEYNFPAGSATKGSDNVISPVGSIPRNQINNK